MTTQEEQCFNLLVKAVSSRKWQLVEKVLKTKFHFGCHTFESKCFKDCSRRHSILHFVLQHDAPFYIIQNIVKDNHQLVFESDCMGQ